MPKAKKKYLAPTIYWSLKDHDSVVTSLYIRARLANRIVFLLYLGKYLGTGYFENGREDLLLKYPISDILNLQASDF